MLHNQYLTGFPHRQGHITDDWQGEKKPKAPGVASERNSDTGKVSHHIRQPPIYVLRQPS